MFLDWKRYEADKEPEIDPEAWVMFEVGDIEHRKRTVEIVRWKDKGSLSTLPFMFAVIPQTWTRPGYYSGGPVGSYARRWQDGEFAKDHIEMEIVDLLNFDFDITTDDYDNSIEIFPADGVPLENRWLADEKFSALIQELGFERFWVNWPDGKEQAGTGPLVQKDSRKTPFYHVALPKTEEGDEKTSAN